MPLSSCICNFAPLMEKVGRVTAKFKDSVEVKMKSVGSLEASKCGVKNMCVVVNERTQLPLDFDEKTLEDVITKCLEE